MKYTSTFVGNNMYQIETIFNNESIIFNVVVAIGEVEIEGLVEFYLNGLANPPVYTALPEPVPSTVAELMAELQILTARLEALEAK